MFIIFRRDTVDLFSTFRSNQFRELISRHFHQADFSSLRDVSRFAKEVLEQYQCLDLLINNAGDD
jgi:NAD(P)-dependent dehydrogenase (short-subunit alcohol dehydrogenase family)